MAAEKIKNCRPGNEQGEESNHHESDDARCLFGSDNDGHTCGLCTAGQVTSEQFTKSVKVLMNIPQPYYNHYGGMITFGPDGKLYIGKGDAGWEGDPLNAGQNLNVLWGKLLRIDVDTADDVAYAIPKDNPFG